MFKDSHNECLNNFFWFKIFITNILMCVNVYRMFECDKNQMPYCKKIKESFEFLKILGH
jgi:hypothetical protein